MRFFWLLFTLVLVQSCTTAPQYDLVITNAKIFDVASGTVVTGKNILIAGDTIAGIVDASEKATAVKTIDASGKLVIPGMIDTHTHPSDVLGDYDRAPKTIPADSANVYRERISATYLPYGITTIMMMGEPEAWVAPTMTWVNNPLPDQVDMYTTGGALISKETRKPYISHMTVESPLAAKQKVQEYYDLGIRHIKLYSRLRKPEMEAALHTADSLHMHVFGHIGHVDYNVMYIDTSLAMGLKNYEHIFTVARSAFNPATDWPGFLQQQAENGFPENENIPFQVIYMAFFRYTAEHNTARLDALIDLLAKDHATFSTTIQIFNKEYIAADFRNSPDFKMTPQQSSYYDANFNVFMKFAKKLHDKGVKIRLGTDIPDGGKAAIAEQRILFEHGFSVADIIRISTINGAEALGIEKKAGSIEKGKKANLVIYDKNPFDDYRNFSAGRTVIKDGMVYEKK
jgi:hypothetical protein